MSKRRLQKAFLRLKHLPGGIHFFEYAFNKLLHFFFTIAKSTRVAHPSSLMIEVTNHCNLRCITCPREYSHGHTMDKGYIELDNLKKIVDEAYPFVDSIGLTGLGETLMFKDLIPAVKYIRDKNKGIIVFISTNAHLPAAVETIAQTAGMIDTVQISIDGIGEVYEHVRRGGRYDFFIDNVKQIIQTVKNTRTQVMLNMVVIRENFHQMTEMVQLANVLKVRYLNFTLFNLASVTDLDVSYYDFYQTPEFLDQLIKANKLARTCFDLEYTVWDYCSLNGFRKCIFPWSHFYITWDGYLTPCCAKPFPKELHFGNVLQDGLMTCLNSQGFRDFRSMWYRNETPAFCEKCHMIDLKPIMSIQ
jgi:radical SAM protein with 4Fe4S-binding SPASM domain